MDWVFRRVTDIILNLNERFFKFDIFGLNEGFQFTNYEAPSVKVDTFDGLGVNKGLNVAKLFVGVSVL